MAKGKPPQPRNGPHRGLKKTIATEDPVKECAAPPLEPLVQMEWHSYVALGIFLSVYIKCTAASIPSGDAGDFILSAQHFGVAHPPGYPLYVTFGHIWMKLLPFGNPAYKLNLLTSIVGGGAAFIVYHTTHKVTQFIPSAIFASGVFGFSHLIWFHSVGAEIFSLNNAFCGLLLFWVARFQHASPHNRATVAIEASFVSGLSMCNQHTSALFIAVIGSWMFLTLVKDKGITMKQFIQTGVAFAVALIPYIQLPISSFFARAPSTWGDQRTVSGFWKHFTREEYGTFRLTADDRPSDFIGNTGTYTEDLVHELGMVTLVLTVVCLATAWYFPEIRSIVYVYLLTGLAYVLFFCNQANIDHSKQLMKGVLERFWMQSNIVVSVLSGCGVWCVYRLSQTILHHLLWKRVVYVGLTCAALAASLAQINQNYAVCDLSDNLIMRDYGRKLLDASPKNSVLLVEGDMPSLTSRYLRYSEGYRTDVDVVDQELIGFSWFKPMHKHNYNNYIFPHDREVYYRDVLARVGENKPFSYDFQNLFDVHREAGIEVRIYPFMKTGDELWKNHYEMTPVSMLFQMIPKDSPMSVDTFLDIAFEYDYNFGSNMAYCDSSLYPARSWEYVIAESCVHTAFFPPEHAHRLVTSSPGGGVHALASSQPLLKRILKLYERAAQALTLADSRIVYSPDHQKNYGILAYLIYVNMQSHGVIGTGEKGSLEEIKYARVMYEQWSYYYARSGDQDDASGLRPVMGAVLRTYPDLLTNPAYVL